MLQDKETLPDECPKCGKKLIACTCSSKDLDDDEDDDSSASIDAAPPRVFPILSHDDPSTAVVEPRIGLPNWNNRSPRRNDWVEIEDPERYNLPPLDHNLYDIKRFQYSRDKFDVSQRGRSLSRSTSRSPSKTSALKRALTGGEIDESPPKLDYQNEEFYMRRGCWCKDCPWLIAYAILALFWLIILGIIWARKSFTDEDYITIKDSRCVITCSQMIPPSVPLGEPKISPLQFSCEPDVRKWETDIFKPWVIEIFYRNNPNCVQDCKNMGFTKFRLSCITRDASTDSSWDSFENPANSIIYVDSIRQHWFWIVHVIVITNAISLFILLIPLFFCCPMVAFFVFASIAASLVLMVMLWWDVARIITRHEDDDNGLETISSQIAKWVYSFASTMFTGYIIFNAFLIFKRFRVTCTVAGLSSRVVNAVPMILLESIITLLLLAILIGIILFATLGVEAANPLFLRGGETYFVSTPLTWCARIATVVLGYWTYQLIINCQTIIVHGAMTRYYFEKTVKNRVLKAHKRLLKHHICTACFSGLLFNWFYWIRWFHRKSRIRSRSLFGTGAFGLCFCPASKVVKQLIFQDAGLSKRIDKANPYFFLVHMFVVQSIAITAKAVFSGPYHSAVWTHLLMISYAYFVGLSAINIYRVTKDAMYLCYLEDRTLSKDNPSRDLKMPHHISNFFALDPKVIPR
ncbi:hypothetical protein GE061_003475 [Apolygus lucorum]|uniref:Choline transporter-like protein n=1 Tax=Apolygus lucorum TaxID=248454 RepID=A0A6A4JV64_APOLU|nr:hypothetical protein GE061_003475 [Apolygus lucorum]